MICFQSEPRVSNFLGVLDCASDLSRYKKQKAQTGRWRGVVISALDLYTGGPGFKSSSLSLEGFVFGCPRFNSSTLCK